MSHRHTHTYMYKHMMFYMCQVYVENYHCLFGPLVPVWWCVCVCVCVCVCQSQVQEVFAWLLPPALPLGQYFPYTPCSIGLLSPFFRHIVHPLLYPQNDSHS